MITFQMSLTPSPVTTAVTAYPRDQYHQPVPPAEQVWTCSQEISRMLSAAVVNRRFCQLLLTDPLLALRGGYNGETFQLSADEIDLLLSVQATTLRDFAAQLLMAGAKRLQQSATGLDMSEEPEALTVRNGRLGEKFIH